MLVESVEPEELVELIRLYNFRIIVLDLQQHKSSESVEKLGHLRGSSWLPGLAGDLAESPNAGSAAYSLLMNQKLMNLIRICKPEILIAYDSTGEQVAQKFCTIVKDRLLSISEDPLWHRMKYLCHLNGGLQRFRSLFPQLCIDWHEADEYQELVPVDHSNRMPEAVISQIFPYLYLSGIHGASIDVLNRNQIRHVLSIGEEPEWSQNQSSQQQPALVKHFISTVTPSSSALNQSSLTFNGTLTETLMSPSKRPIEVSVTEYQQHSLTHYMYSLEDVSHAPIHKIFIETAQIIKKAQESQEPVLVHCFSGQSRSTSVVIAYLMHELEMSLSEAFAITFDARPFVRPNTGFWSRLQSLETDLMQRRRSNSNPNEVLRHSKVLQHLESTGSTLPPGQLRSLHPDRIRRWLEFRKGLSSISSSK